MIWLLYFSIGIVVLAIVFLAIYAIKIFKNTTSTIKELNTVSGRIQSRIESLTDKAEGIQQKTELINEDIEYKKQSVQVLLDSFKETKPSLRSLQHNVRTTNMVEEEAKASYSYEVNRMLDWGNTAIDLYSKFASKKERK